MVDRGDYILVDVNELTAALPALMLAVEREARSIRISHNGKIVAEMRPASEPVDPLQLHPEIVGVQVSADAFAPATKEEWPEECR